MTTTKSAGKKTTRRIARKLTSAFTKKASRAMSRRNQLEMKAALERHSRKCIICHHPEREAIEEEFLHWRAPWKLAEDYNLADYRTIYRHARASGLLLQRRENLHSGLDAFVEAVDDVKFTGDTILRAMRAYSCIDRHGRWTEIPTQVHISTFRDGRPPESSARNSSIIDIEPEQLEEDLEEDEEEYDDPEDRWRRSAMHDLNIQVRCRSRRPNRLRCLAPNFKGLTRASCPEVAVRITPSRSNRDRYRLRCFIRASNSACATG